MCLTIVFVEGTYFDSNEYSYVLAIFSYFVFSYSVHEFFIKGICEIFLSQHTINKSSKFENKIISNELSNSLATETVNDLYKGLSVQFIDIKCQLTKSKPELFIENLSVQSGEKILITGSGSQLIVPLMKRILIPIQGRIQYGSTNISQSTMPSLMKILEIIPFNPRLNDANVR